MRHDARLQLIDAREVIAAVMVGGLPDEARFRWVVGAAVERGGAAAGSTGTVRVFGEAGDVLGRGGNAAAAIRLEDLWHARVVPTERFTLADDAARAVEIGVLQQRARALETELVHRAEMERQLPESLAAAEQANQVKSEFLAVMSHELRTPLNAIAGYAQLLEIGVHGPLTEPQRDAVDRIYRSERHLLGLILLSNAVELTERGGAVGVGCEADAVWVRIRVRDTGIGIPRDRAGAIFEPFVQLDTRLTRVREGMGLSISRELARGMGGELELEQTSPSGSTFLLTLPHA